MRSRSPNRAGLAAVASGLVVLVAATPAPAHVPTGARGGEPVAAPASLEQTISARQRFFGALNVHPRTGALREDRLILSWFGVTNFAMAIRGHVVLLDAWVPRGAHSGYVPTSPAELAMLAPEAILIGHGHFDHAADAVPLALATGATLVGTAEHCADFATRGPEAPECIAALAEGVAAGASARPKVLDRVGVTAVKHLHSGATAPDGEDGYHVPVAPPPSTTVLENPPTPEDLLALVGQLPDAEGGSVLYRFRVGEFSVVWNDSAGPLSDDAPGALDVLGELGPVDVQVGAIQGFNQLTNGMRDPRQYIEALAPETFVPAHHDDWAFGITTNGEAYREPFFAELERLAPEQRPEVRFIVDPADYVRPEALTFGLPKRPMRLRATCTRSNRLRVGLRRDFGRVERVRFRVGPTPAVGDARPRFKRLLSRRAARAAAESRVRARITLLDGDLRRLAVRARGCGRGRSAGGPAVVGPRQPDPSAQPTAPAKPAGSIAGKR
ncbi:MAG: MBL fold metallo-hydrolase [Solirubrobacterales bacterium]